MDEMIMLIQFMALPFVATLLFSISLPVVGVSLSTRNELLLPLTLPILSGFVLSLIHALGLSHEMHWLMVSITIIAVFGIYYMLQNKIKNGVQRQMVLAGLFISSEALTRLIVSLKPEIEGEFKELLRGEMLAVGGVEVAIVGGISALFLILLIIFYPLFRVHTLDELALRRFRKEFLTTDIAIKLFTTIFIVFGVITVGPLVTTAVLILPSLFGDSGRSGLVSALVTSVVIALISSLISFPFALMKDIPPAYAVAVGMLLVGLCTRVTNLIIKSKKAGV